MSLTLRHRIVLTLVPLLLLLVVLGTAGVVLLLRLGASTRQILRENYDSVRAMERLNEALERIDSSFQIALSGTDDKWFRQAREQYDENWDVYEKQLDIERNNITLPGEAGLVADLESLTREYRERGDDFHSLPETDPRRNDAYYGRPDAPGLLQLFGRIKDVKEQILRINQNNMEAASDEARRLARESLIWFAAGMAVAIAL